ncbi:MAG TPA: tetratricopeptide repeat protein [Pyrinomonadaceae bacterium]|nr:tetratricopeptide repeat protein [Pyrinomonadaceae bacterium]
MTLTKTTRQRAAACFSLPLAAVFLIGLSTQPAGAQQPSSGEQMQTLMTHRQELSTRSIEEPLQRRFEDKISDTTFPSDRKKAAANGGVLAAHTPEQQKALQHNERGLSLFDKGKFDGAIKEYEEAVRLDPKLAAAYNNLGSAHFAAGRFEEAASAFRRASELGHDSGLAFFNLALAQIKLGRQDEANGSLNLALSHYQATGEAHLKESRLKEAEESFLGMLRIDPEYTPALLRLGLVCTDAHRYEEAEQYLRRVVDREPRNAVAHELLGEALFGQRKYEPAVASADTAIRISPRLSDSYYTAGRARASMGQREAALAYLARLNQLKPPLAQKLSDFIDKTAPAK